MNFVEYQKSVVYQKSKDKKCKKLCQKLSNTSINNGLDLKTTLVWEKKKRIIASKISSILVQCSLKCGLYFLASDNFKGTFVDFRFMMFAKVLMKESARILIHVRKICNYRVSFKMLLLTYLVIVEKKL